VSSGVGFPDGVLGGADEAGTDEVLVGADEAGLEVETPDEAGLEVDTPDEAGFELVDAGLDDVDDGALELETPDGLYGVFLSVRYQFALGSPRHSPTVTELLPLDLT